MLNYNVHEENWEIQLPHWQNFPIQNLVIDIFSDYRKKFIQPEFFLSLHRRARHGSSYYPTWNIDKIRGNSKYSFCSGLIDIIL